MMRLMMRPTDEYERLVKFFVENGLEFDGDEEVDTDILNCYKITHGDDDFLAGAVVLAKREGRYIIDGIAVDKMYRKMNVGGALLKKVVSKVKEYGGNELYLVARAPEFFRKQGFVTVDVDSDESAAPTFFECRQCPQYRVSCNPEVMKLVIE